MSHLIISLIFLSKNMEDLKPVHFLRSSRLSLVIKGMDSGVKMRVRGWGTDLETLGSLARAFILPSIEAFNSAMDFIGSVVWIVMETSDEDLPFGKVFLRMSSFGIDMVIG